MSAPRPDGRQFGRYIGMKLREVDDVSGSPVIDGWAPVNDFLRGPDGAGMSAGALLTLADGAGGLCGGLAALPRWVVSTNLMLRMARPDHVGPIRARARVLRVGRRSGVVTGIELRDDGNADALVAEAVLTSAALEPPEGMPLPNHPIAIDPGPPPEIEGSLRDALGITEIDPSDGYDAAVRLDVTDEVRNPWGIVHGGATAVLIDVVADAAQAGALTEAVVHFLRPGRVGPIEARARIIGGAADATLCIDLVDT
ncbi:MAG: hotdog domain-containing protein, partial [Acidimicrobiia bacterium]